MARPTTEPRRFRYCIDLTTYRPRRPELLPESLPESLSGVIVRSPTPADHDLLAGLMLDAYRGTIDYEGEEIEEAGEAIQEFFAQETMLGPSRLAVIRDRSVQGGSVEQAVSAVLAATYLGTPFISYVITAAAHKRAGLGRALVVDSLNRMQADGLDRVYLAITEGNVASEGLFRSLGAYLDPQQTTSDGDSS